ncbi:MAG: ABC transporter permease [Actinobacteria bacterium]|nr:ABC transporter permease [Actinomycetota bacterium]
MSRWAEDPRARQAANWLAGLAAFYWVLERLWPAPAGVLLKGTVIGGLYSMIALGIALVYRANRIINFAQGDLGGAPAALAILLIVSKGWPYPLAIGTGLAAGLALGVVIEFVVIRRFAKAPRLILTVVTLGLSSVLAVAEIGLPSAFHVTIPPQNFPSPFNFSFAFHKVQFQGNDVLAMLALPVVIGALAWFLNRTNMGVAVRACSESADRASLLGVPVKRVNMVVWAVASLLATVALILRAGVVGLPLGSALGLSVLLRTLAAAAIGRMDRMPTIVVASILFGIVEQSVVWHTGSSDIVDLVSFLVIMGALIAQRTHLASRAEEAALSTWTALREVRPTPPELSGLAEVVWVQRGLGAIIGMVAVALPFVIGEARTDLAVTLIVFMIVALSILVLTGWAGQISLGQFAFVGVGMTVGAWMTLHWHIDIVANLVISGLVGAVVAVVIGVPALRIRGLFLAVATLGFTFACSSYFLNYTHFGWVPTQNERLERLPVFGRVVIDTETRYFFFCLAVLLVCTLAVRGLRRSRIGRVLIAVRENERGVQAYGVNVIAAKLTAFAISGFLAAMAGVLLVHLQFALYPGSVDPVSSLKAFEMAVIGGLGSIPGVFAGAIYVQGLSWFRSSFPSALRPLIELLGSGVGLIVILMFLPGGVGSVIYKVRDRLLRRLADNKGIIVPSLVADAAEPTAVGQDEVVAAMAGASDKETAGVGP